MRIRAHDEQTSTFTGMYIQTRTAFRPSDEATSPEFSSFTSEQDSYVGLNENDQEDERQEQTKLCHQAENVG